MGKLDSKVLEEMRKVEMRQRQDSPEEDELERTVSELLIWMVWLDLSSLSLKSTLPSLSIRMRNLGPPLS